MTTIVIHGTMTTQRADKAGNWWWHPNSSFCTSLDTGLSDSENMADVWHVDGYDVEQHPELPIKQNRPFMVRHGRFLWSGLNQPDFRRSAGKELALYLNLIHQTAPDEPIRIVAHSHGCNVVKIASSHRALNDDIYIERAVFLACPHFEGVGLGFKGKYPYQLNLDRFGGILNLYSEEDSVQIDVASVLPSVLGGGLFEWAPTAYRTDPDPDAQAIYDDWSIPTEDSGTNAHTAMHGASLGYLSGLWIGDPDYFKKVIQNTDLLPVPYRDYGE